MVAVPNQTPTFFSAQLFYTTEAVDPEDMPYLHHGKRPRFRDRPKFKSPRVRASINLEAVENSKARNPQLWETRINVGDAVEFVMVIEGGVDSEDTEKLRGVVLGKFNKGLDTSILIRDVILGQTIERRIPMHSPLIKSVKVLEPNFVYKGKRKIKRAKMYFLRDRNPLCKFVTTNKHAVVDALAKEAFLETVVSYLSLELSLTLSLSLYFSPQTTVTKVTKY
jgi:large subunit ribosomal protein L19